VDRPRNQQANQDAGCRCQPPYATQIPMGGMPEAGVAILQADRTWISKKDDMQCTPLHHAARFGFVEVARWLLTQGADVNAKAYNDFTPLHLTRHPEIVKLLIEHKADVKATSAFGGTALQAAADHFAILERNPEWAGGREKARKIIKMLLDAGAEYDILSACYLNDMERIRVLVADKKQARDKGALRCAATLGRPKIVKLLLEHGADPNTAYCGGLTISYYAVQHADVLKLLFDAGADPKVRLEWHGNGAGPQGSTLLHEAVGSVESVKLLLAQGIDVNLTNDAGATVLHVACRNGHVPTVEWLLKNRADATARTKGGWTPMSLAAYQIRPEHEEDNARYQAVIRALERAGVELDVFAAISCNDVQHVVKILQTDPKMGEARNPAGRPALHLAVMLDRKEIVRLLLDKGCSPDVPSRAKGVGYEGETALHEAAFWGRLEIAEMLIKRGAKVNAKAARGVVPLHEAARMGHVELARLLLMHGADVNAKDEKGSTPLDWADKESPKMIKLLRDRGGMK
jgi:ankyrin